MPQTYVSEMVIALGPIMSIGKLINVRAEGSDKYKQFFMACPDCATPTKVKQRYLCEQTLDLGRDDWHIHEPADLLRARILDDDTVAFVDKDAIAAAKKSELPLNVLKPTVHPADEVASHTRPSENAYLFLPKLADEYYQLMVKLVEDRTKAFVAMCNLRNVEGLYQLDTWQGHIVIQKLVWPDEVNFVQPLNIEVDSDILASFKAVLEAKTVGFDPSSYSNNAKERYEDLVASLGAAKPKKSKKAAPKKDDGKKDLKDMLVAWAAE